MPATGERAPARTLVTVRAIVPVAGMPPKSGTTKLAMPCAISSWFGSWRGCVDEVVGDARAQQRLDRAEQRDRQRRDEELLRAVPAERRQRERRAAPCGMPPKREPIVSTGSSSSGAGDGQRDQRDDRTRHARGGAQREPSSACLGSSAPGENSRGHTNSPRGAGQRRCASAYGLTVSRCVAKHVDLREEVGRQLVDAQARGGRATATARSAPRCRW